MCARFVATAIALLTCVHVLFACDLGYFPRELCCCSMHFRPVCGNNNRTYHNYCILRCMRITHNHTLEMAHRWECGTPEDERIERDKVYVPLVGHPPTIEPENDTEFHWENYANLE
uniref:Kazal-like domain-containing protein n=1 Tax=Anopheles christyi TaxID=43041 RepID=A0A182JPM2_9DIPT